MCKNFKEKVCIICGETFKTNIWNKICCCKECSKINEKNKIKEYDKKRYSTKRIEILNKCKEYAQKNKIKIQEYQKQYKQLNKEKRNKYERDRYKNNTQHKLTILIRENFRRCINSNKDKHTFDILGYTPLQLKQRLEFQFKNGMTWDNHGIYWEIHHKKPLSLFNFELPNGEIDYKQIRLANSLANLQPLTIEEHKKIHEIRL